MKVHCAVLSFVRMTLRRGFGGKWKVRWNKKCKGCLTFVGIIPSDGESRAQEFGGMLPGLLFLCSQDLMVQIIRQEHEPVKSFVSCVKRFPSHENERFYVSRVPYQLNRTVVRLSVGLIEVELLQTSCPLHPAMPNLRIPKSFCLYPAKPILVERMMAGEERVRLHDLIPVVELLLSNTQIREEWQKAQYPLAGGETRREDGTQL